MKIIREQQIRKNLIVKLIQFSSKLFSVVLLNSDTGIVYSHTGTRIGGNTDSGIEYVAIKFSRSTAYRRFNSFIKEFNKK